MDYLQVGVKSIYTSRKRVGKGVIMFNLVVLTGRLTADPELKTTTSGISVCSFSIAVDRAYKKGEEKQTDFFTAIFWRGLAEMVVKYFNKGKEIVISGEMQSRKWQDREGNSHIAWEVMANSVDFCGAREAKETNTIPFPKETDDLPF